MDKQLRRPGWKNTRMKKFFIVFSLLLFILITSSFTILKLLANGAEDSFFNTKYRAKVAGVPTLRKIFGMHFDGDAASDYLGDRYKKIFVEIDTMQGITMPKEAMDLLIEKIRQTTGKEVSAFQFESIPATPTVTMDQIDSVVARYRNNIESKDTANLYILYLSQMDSEQSSNIGSTYNEYGVLLFDAPLQSLTQRNPKTLAEYIESTALHEFGHQIGLPHNDLPHCLMNPAIDEGEVIRELASDVLVDFCDYEKELIQTNK
jgi:predicted Zn-dependent protease